MPARVKVSSPPNSHTRANRPRCDDEGKQLMACEGMKVQILGS